ncbi:hypothetical protein OH76DRAFT_1517019 [Lentinus brumalis]|uniref:Uncharacterized protein n=1 Tax=Lentinus brumalis TaxID=2498619 RepID=A0A371CHH1_9APHY|nr:hypothetical protein OH76DRAFT_1517019 [Polyporus brumalis]
MSMKCMLHFKETLSIMWTDIDLCTVNGHACVQLKLPFRKTHQSGNRGIHVPVQPSCCTQLITLKQANTVEQEANNVIAQENKDNVAQENKDNVVFDHKVTYQILQEMDSSILIHANEACQSLVALVHMALKAGQFDDEDDEEVVKQCQCICMYLASVYKTAQVPTFHRLPLVLQPPPSPSSSVKTVRAGTKSGGSPDGVTELRSPERDALRVKTSAKLLINALRIHEGLQFKTDKRTGVYTGASNE